MVWFFMLALQKHRIRDIIAKIHGQKCVTTEPFAGISDGSHTWAQGKDDVNHRQCSRVA